MKALELERSGKDTVSDQRFCFSREEMIVSVLRSVNDDIAEMINHAENNDLQRELVREKLKGIAIKMKNLNNVSGKGRRE